MERVKRSLSEDWKRESLLEESRFPSAHGSGLGDKWLKVTTLGTRLIWPLKSSRCRQAGRNGRKSIHFQTDPCQLQAVLIFQWVTLAFFILPLKWSIYLLFNTLQFYLLLCLSLSRTPIQEGQTGQAAFTWKLSFRWSISSTRCDSLGPESYNKLPKVKV